MYLSDFQKDLVRCLNKEGSEGIHNMMLNHIAENDIVFTKRQYNSDPRGKGAYINSFFVEFHAKDPDALRKIPRIRDPFSAYSNKTEEDFVPDPSIYDVFVESEIKLKQNSLLEFQKKIEAALHLFQRLAASNLIILYTEDIPRGYEIGHIERQKNDEILSFEIRKETYGNQNRLYACIDSFFSARMILLPGLLEFVNNKFLTNQEIDRQLEIKQLKKQTRYVLFGILVSALITLIPTLLECTLEREGKIEPVEVVAFLST